MLVVATGGLVALFANNPVLSVWLYWLAILFWIPVSGFVLKQRVVDTSRTVKVLCGSIIIAAAIVALSELRNASPPFLFLLMAIVWISDTSAYAIGRVFGKRKLAPKISPGKSWEGVAGALVAVSLYGAVLKFFFDGFLQRQPGIQVQSPEEFILTWVLLAIAGILGDLGESWAKRVAGVKDSGRCLPGHGGVLDRVDALLPVLPLAALVYLRNSV